MITSPKSQLDNPTRAMISDLQARMLAMPQVDIPVTQCIVNGMLPRTIMIPAGTRLIGAIHLTDHINIMCGDITIYSEEGEVRLTGYNVIPSKAGSKRVGFAHADTCWTTILRTDLLDPDEAVRTMTAKDYDDPRVIAMDKLTEIGE